jgi:hypothetical protein
MIGAIAILLLSYCFITFAEPITSSSSEVIMGTLISLNQSKEEIKITTEDGVQTLSLAKSVWVYRNQQKSALAELRQGDLVELILNSKKQVAYIKAKSEESINQKIDPSEESKENRSTLKTEENRRSNFEESTSVHKDLSPQPQIAATEQKGHEDLPAEKNIMENVEKIEVHIKGRGLKIRLKYEEGHGKGNAKVDIETGHEKIHLKGDQAKSFIKQILSTTDPSSLTNKEEAISALAQALEINPDHYDFKIEIKADNLNLKVDHQKGQDKPKHNQ